MTTRTHTCPYCQAPATIRDTAEIYDGRSYGLALICTRFPTCDAYVGCHKGTAAPMGTMANGKLRFFRRAAHRAFDPMWKNGVMRRRAAYKVLSEALGIHVKQTHISHFDVERCQEVVRVIGEQRERFGL